MEAYRNDVCSRYRGLHLALRLRAAADGLTGDAQARALGLALDELKRATRATELYKQLAARTGATTYHTCVCRGGRRLRGRACDCRASARRRPRHIESSGSGSRALCDRATHPTLPAVPSRA
jgi:hypothetical protein